MRWQSESATQFITIKFQPTKTGEFHRALRIKTSIGWRRAVLAFVNWLALSWTVALACLQGLTRSRGTFLRTPKTGEHNRVLVP